MANMVDAVLAKGIVFVSRWLGVVVLVVFILGRVAAASARRLGSTRSTSAGRLPPMGQQFLDPTVQLRRQSGKHVLEVGRDKPHTALHTAGDMFWWLTRGVPEGRMPGFELQMSTDDRWDAVNFLRAFSAGFQARILTTAVEPGKPWLGPPDFDFSTTTGSPEALKDYRDRQTVLLVFYSWPGSRARLDQLAQSYPALRSRNTEVLAIPLPGTVGSPPAGLPYPTVGDGSENSLHPSQFLVDFRFRLRFGAKTGKACLVDVARRLVLIEPNPRSLPSPSTLPSPAAQCPFHVTSMVLTFVRSIERYCGRTYGLGLQV